MDDTGLCDCLACSIVLRQSYFFCRITWKTKPSDLPFLYIAPCKLLHVSSRFAPCREIQQQTPLAVLVNMLFEYFVFMILCPKALPWVRVPAIVAFQTYTCCHELKKDCLLGPEVGKWGVHNMLLHHCGSDHKATQIIEVIFVRGRLSLINYNV